MDWIATLFSIIGTFYIVKKHYYGQLFYLISNILWISYAFTNHINSQLLLFVFYLIMSIIGLKQWFAEHKQSLATKNV